MGQYNPTEEYEMKPVQLADTDTLIKRIEDLERKSINQGMMIEKLRRDIGRVKNDITTISDAVRKARG